MQSGELSQKSLKELNLNKVTCDSEIGRHVVAHYWKGASFFVALMQAMPLLKLPFPSATVKLKLYTLIIPDHLQPVRTRLQGLPRDPQR